MFLDLVVVHGPWIVFLLAILETSFVTGLIAPSGVATSIATGIALEEGSSVLPVVLAALAGGAIGDNVGFWIGRSWRERWVSGSGRFARRVRDIQMPCTPERVWKAVNAPGAGGDTEGAAMPHFESGGAAGNQEQPGTASTEGAGQ